MEGEDLEEAKLINYVQVKKDYSTEPYVTSTLKRGQMSLCAQLRGGTSPSAIELGSYKDIVEEQSLCIFCDLGVVEDEFYCPVYNDLRGVLFERI